MREPSNIRPRARDIFEKAPSCCREAPASCIAFPDADFGEKAPCAWIEPIAGEGVRPASGAGLAARIWAAAGGADAATPRAAAGGPRVEEAVVCARAAPVGAAEAARLSCALIEGRAEGRLRDMEGERFMPGAWAPEGPVNAPAPLTGVPEGVCGRSEAAD